jgi:hypothetical protein
MKQWIWILMILIPAVGARTQSVIINELSASVTSSQVDNYGEFEDWIEIYNASGSDIDLAGWFLSDNPDKPLKWKFASDYPKSTILHAGAYKVIWADKDTLQGVDHLNFSLKKSGEKLFLHKPGNGLPQLADSITYPKLQADQSYGRCPLHEGGWTIFKRPTAGKPNLCPDPKSRIRKTVPQPEPPGYDLQGPGQVSVDFSGTPTVSLNEISANTKQNLADESGEYDDWIELYNNTGANINVAGWYISDTLHSAAYHRIPSSDPAKTTILAGGYLILWADGQTAQGANHLPFKLEKGGEEIVLARLVSGQYQAVDHVIFPGLKNDVTYGRVPDGTGGWGRLSDPTPRSANRAPRILGGFFMNELMAVSGSGMTDEYGEEEDWIELFNPTAEPVNIGGLYLTDSLAEPARSRITPYSPDSTTIPAGGYLLLFADSDTWQGARHLGFKLAGEGGDLALVQPDGITTFSVTSYPEQTDAHSFGRFPDGSARFEALVPTPGNPNSTLSAITPVQSGPVISVFPNPAVDVLNVRIYLENPSRVSATVNSENGIRHQEIHFGLQGSGMNILQFPAGTRDMPAGNYVLQVKAGHMTSSRSFTVIK